MVSSDEGKKLYKCYTFVDTADLSAMSFAVWGVLLRHLPLVRQRQEAVPLSALWNLQDWAQREVLSLREVQFVFSSGSARKPQVC